MCFLSLVLQGASTELYVSDEQGWQECDVMDHLLLEKYISHLECNYVC